MKRRCVFPLNPSNIVHNFLYILLPTSLVNTLRSIAYFGVARNSELVIVDMCNFVSAWTQEDMIALYYYLEANETTCTCIFLVDMGN